MNSQALQFKIASEEWEFEQIHRLNYRTFVDEIPQHEPSSSQRLIDKYHPENSYAICLCGDQLVGMVAGRGKRPFSLDQKLENLDSYLPAGRRILEVRLLAVEKAHRSGQVFCGLLATLGERFRNQGYDLAVISGTTRQQNLYRHLGFIPFGPLVGTPPVLFQPMYLTLERYVEKSSVLLRPLQAKPKIQKPISFLPGPVAIHPEVRRVFSQMPVSHRSASFVTRFQETQRQLSALVGSKYAAIFMGSGTLANDVIAGQLSLLKQPGLVLSNGEFGNRLIDQGSRFGLTFDRFEAEWGAAFNYTQLEKFLRAKPKLAWIWAVHCETSTGVLNDLARFKELSAARGLRLCMDCISSIGTVPVDLRNVYLASGVSGKGLASFPGLSMVFHNHEVAPSPRALPRYLDLGNYAAYGIPFTHSSNLLEALSAALHRILQPARFQEVKQIASWLRSCLQDLGFQLVASDSDSSPAVVSMALPKEISSEAMGSQLEREGYLLSYRSDYLLHRNWMQICLMGDCSREKLNLLLDALKSCWAKFRAQD